MKPAFKAGVDYVLIAPVRPTEDVTHNKEDEHLLQRHQAICDTRRKRRDVSKGSDRMTIRRRDVVLFRHEGKILLHRIVHVWGTLLLLRGDNCYGPYERATVSDVLGIVIGGTWRGGRRFKASSRVWRGFSRFWTGSYRSRLWSRKSLHILRKPFRHSARKQA
ncbi:MAG: hypothetical protein HUJ89_05350 [Bacteroidales bacterium]|nr:hypothetical protein [Bacteroidales bacterium]